MVASWIVLLPPLVILLTAFLSRNIILSIALGIVSAVLVVTNFSLVAAGALAYKYFSAQLFRWDTVNIYGFLIVLGTIVYLINATGAPCAFSRFVSRHLQSQKTVETSALTVSLFLGIDDYLNALMTGCIMKPLTDTMRIARVKLAFLLDVIASPLVVLVPISSWIAFIVSGLQSVGFSDAFSLYMHSIPFIFYSFIVMASAWFIVRLGLSYGPMRTHEQVAKETGNLYGGKQARFDDSAVLKPEKAGELIDFVLPIGLLIVGVIVNRILDVEIFAALMLAACLAFIVSGLFALTRKKVSLLGLWGCVRDGFKLMYPSIILVFCALIFGNIIQHELHTGEYLAQLILPGINAAWLPIIVFLMSTVTALTIGSSWGAITIGTTISLPMIFPFVAHNPALLCTAIGAIISGAIAGAQLCPIADPVTIAATSSGCYQLDHVKTQAAYLLPVILGTCVAFGLSGYLTCTHPMITAGLCVLSGLAVSFSGLLVCNKIWK